MTARSLPGLNLMGFWELYETSWKTGMDENLLKLSMMTQARIKSVVSVLPAAPNEGDVHLHFHGTFPEANMLIAYDNGGWVTLAPFVGMTLFNEDIGGEIRWDGAVWVEIDSPEHIKSIYESATDTNAFTDDDRAKLDGIEASADVNWTREQIKSMYEDNPDTNAFTDDDKLRLFNLTASRFLGTYVSLTALTAAHPAPPTGSYAYVDLGTGVDITGYVWDATDNQYVAQSGSISLDTPEAVKLKYEFNDDTNAFTDAEKLKLAGYDPDAPSLPVGGTTGQMLVKVSATDGDANWQDQPTIVFPDAELPDTTGQEGKVLTVDVSGSPAWLEPEAGGSVFPVTTGQEGKVLTVDPLGEPVWDAIPTVVIPDAELPATTGNEGKILRVNPTGDGVLWDNEVTGSGPVEDPKNLPHRGWRIRRIASASTNFVGLIAMRFNRQINSVYPGITVVNSQYASSGQYSGNSVFDDDPATYWGSAIGVVNDVHIGRYLNAPINVHTLTIQGSSDSTQTPTQFAIEYSDDNITWYEHSIVTTPAWGTSEIREFVVQTGVVYTFDEQQKLFGIETGATADQTGTEIVSLIDTELGSADWQTGGGGGGTALPTTVGQAGKVLTVNDLEEVVWKTIGEPEEVPHTHWRLLFTANNGSPDFTALAGLKFFNEADVNVAVFSTAFASSYISIYQPDWGFRTETSNPFWCSASGSAIPSHIGCVLAAPEVITKFSFSGRSALDRTPKDIQLQYSDDGVTWTTRETFEGVTWASYDGSEIQTFLVGTPPAPVYTTEAPIDGKEYARKDAGWVEVTLDGVGISDAPSNANAYVRKGGAWVVETVGGGGSGGGIEEAPDDGKIYGRKNLYWSEVEVAGTLPVGGAAGKVLKKVDGTDFNVTWGDLPEPEFPGKQTLMTITGDITTGVTHWSKFIRVNKATTVTVSIPWTSGAVPDGTVIHFQQVGDGQIFFQGISANVIVSAESFFSRKKNSVVTAMKIGSYLWTIFGDLEAV